MRRADNLTTFFVPIVIKTGSLNILEPSGPVMTCNGIAFAVYILVPYSNSPEEFHICVFLGFRRRAREICALVEYYSA
jgi:hypothetical protein